MRKLRPREGNVPTPVFYSNNAIQSELPSNRGKKEYSFFHVIIPSGFFHQLSLPFSLSSLFSDSLGVERSRHHFSGIHISLARKEQHKVKGLQYSCKSGSNWGPEHTQDLKVTHAIILALGSRMQQKPEFQGKRHLSSSRRGVQTTASSGTLELHPESRPCSLMSCTFNHWIPRAILQKRPIVLSPVHRWRNWGQGGKWLHQGYPAPFP